MCFTQISMFNEESGNATKNIHELVFYFKLDNIPPIAGKIIAQMNYGTLYMKH